MPRGKQTIQGRTYVYEYKNHWNSEKKRSEQKREYIGRIIDGEFVPSRVYKLQMELEAEREKNRRLSGVADNEAEEKVQ
jgi:hypothetical protein